MTRSSLAVGPVSRRTAGLAWVVLALALVGVPGESQAARWYEDYEQAVELIGDGECSREAIRLLGAAVVDKKKPKMSARTIAVKTIDYLPYYQFARAHLACGELESARYYVQESRDRGVAPSSLLDELERRLDQVQGPTPVPQSPGPDPEELAGLVREATETIRRGISASERVDSKRDVEQLSPLFRSNQQYLEQASLDLQVAQDQLSSGTLSRDRSAIEGAAETARNALEVFTSFEAELASVRLVTPTATPIVASPRPTERPTRTPSPRPTAVIPRPRIQPTAIPTAQLPPSGGEDRRPEIPPSLRRAASGYLTAGYEEVVRSLEPDEFSADSHRAAAHLLRGAAHFAIYCLDGRQDEDRLARVRHDLGRCREIDPDLEPDPVIFSPELVELFRSAG